MKQTLLFDLDDTLIYCNKYFHLILEQFADEMTDWFEPHGISRDEILRKQTEIDIAGVQVLGFKGDHFPHSFVETYRYFHHLTGRPSSEREERLLLKLGFSVYELEVEPYPHMNETLEQLAGEGHDLHLYTGGDRKIQLNKIERMDLKRYFGDRIYIRQHKNTEALEQILREGSFDRSATWMIGNSLRTDVLPALQCGINSVYLKQEGEWTYNVVPIEEAQPSGAFLTLHELAEVPPAIRQYLMRSSGPHVSSSPTVKKPS
ncbi:HAD hydrolase-like protein [Cohnella sp. CFH 77786]|uniref:HAD family hydrolase n=1 Tax=Cohnella sp. CFH 77786 TaxID=2662265 RepID=UPI001C60F726|nr:HAD family hydrolase [Cohnella sp. CFH 77786]MBW5448140.1 HAD hydrolase-like protein [Cohnella sp. CFH 77786]